MLLAGSMVVDMTPKLKKAWVWLKRHWWLPLGAIVFLILLIICPFCGSNKNNALIKMFNWNKESYKKEVDAINQSQEEKNKKQEELYAKYVETMKDLTMKYDVDMGSLENKKKKELDTLVKKYKGTPDELARELGEMFGVDYVE